MKKVYERPSLVMEQFETESILTTSDITNTDGKRIIKVSGEEISLGSGQVLQSINWADFKKRN